MTLEGDRLMLALIGFGKYPVAAVSEADFLIREESLQIEFVRGNDGFVRHFVLRRGYSETTVPRR